MKLSVAICTWNRCELLRQTLDQFLHIRSPSPDDWELIVINNNCTDQTDLVVREFEGRLPIRQIFEPEPGLSNARNRAVQEATGTYILWTDDDVLVCEKWLVAYATAFRAHPDHVFFGGPIEPWFPQEPPRWLQDVWQQVGTAYALRDLGREDCELAASKAPFGANYAIRLDIQRRFPYNPALGRIGKQMIGGEETHLFNQLFAQGLKGLWVPEASVRHYIPPDRQTLGYLYRYYHGLAMTSEMLRVRDEGLDPSPRVFGAPRWLWRQAIAGEITFWMRRFSCPIEQWMDDFKCRSRAWGRLAAHRHCNGN